MNILNLFKPRYTVLGEQDLATVRLVLLAAVFLYVLLIGRGDFKTLAFVGGFLAVAIGIYVATRIWPAPNVSRRVLGIVADVAAITTVLFLSSEGAAFAGAYLFVIFGHGFRFGRIYLHLSQLLCIVAFELVFWLVPWWGHELSTFIGWLAAIVILPFYVSRFAERMKATHLETEQALK